MRFHLTLAAGLAVVPGPVFAAVLTVGPGQEYPTIAAAVAASQDGDTIEVSAGTYVNDFAEIQTKITLEAVGGRVTVKVTEDLPNEKGVFITDTDVSITGFTFVGAHIPDSEGGNGAGIRYQGGKLTIVACRFARNQDGLLADADANGTISISRSEFDHNGNASGQWSGYTHNLYVGNVAELDVEDSYFHDAVVGHELKSRAFATTVRNTRIADRSGTASYGVDLPNGGVALLDGDQIEKGPNSENPVMVSFGEEGGILPNSSLTISNSLLENDLTQHVPLGVDNATDITATLDSLSIWGLTPDQIVSGPADLQNITYPPVEPPISTRHPW